MKACASSAQNRPPAPFPSSSAARAAALQAEDRRFESVPREPHPCGLTGKASGCYSERSGFKSSRGCHFFSGDGRAWSKGYPAHHGRGDPIRTERRFESSSPDQRRCSSNSAERTSPKGGDEGSSPSAGANFSCGRGGRSSTVRALDCGSSDVGSIPIDHPKNLEGWLSLGEGSCPENSKGSTALLGSNPRPSSIRRRSSADRATGF